MFIVFEGSEGVGKSTQLQKLSAHLKKENLTHLQTREPGGTPFAEQIRCLFKQPELSTDHPLPMTEFLLLSAARYQHLVRVIEPALSKGIIVLCDRFLDSSYVYQSILGQLSKKSVDHISREILPKITPTLTFILSLNPKESRERLQKERNISQDRYDSKDDLVHTKIHNGFLQIFHEKWSYPSGVIPKRILIDGHKDANDIHAEIWQSITEYKESF